MSGPTCECALEWLCVCPTPWPAIVADEAARMLDCTPDLLIGSVNHRDGQLRGVRRGREGESVWMLNQTDVYQIAIKIGRPQAVLLHAESHD